MGMWQGTCQLFCWACARIGSEESISLALLFGPPSIRGSLVSAWASGSVPVVTWLWLQLDILQVHGLSKHCYWWKKDGDACPEQGSSQCLQPLEASLSLLGYGVFPFNRGCSVEMDVTMSSSKISCILKALFMLWVDDLTYCLKT